MESNLKQFSVMEETVHSLIVETDAAIKQIQDILIKQGAKGLKAKDKSNLKTHLIELARVGEELSGFISEESPVEEDKLRRQHSLIKEVCEMSNLAMKHRPSDGELNKQNKSKLKSASDNLNEIKSSLVAENGDLTSVKIAENIHKHLAAMSKAENIHLNFSEKSVAKSKEHFSEENKGNK